MFWASITLLLFPFPTGNCLPHTRQSPADGCHCDTNGHLDILAGAGLADVHHQAAHSLRRQLAQPRDRVHLVLHRRLADGTRSGVLFGVHAVRPVSPANSDSVDSLSTNLSQAKAPSGGDYHHREHQRQLEGLTTRSGTGTRSADATNQLLTDKYSLNLRNLVASIEPVQPVRRPVPQWDHPGDHGGVRHLPHDGHELGLFQSAALRLAQR